VMNFKVRGQAVATGLILLGYWAIMALVPVPGFGRGNFTMQGNLAAYLDQRFLPHPFCCYDYGDNEDLSPTFPPLPVACWARWQGTGCGRPTRKTQTSGFDRGGRHEPRDRLGLEPGLPIVKNIWSSSFVLFAGGWSLLLLALFYGIIDILGYRKWAFFFTVIGANSITIYLTRHFFNFKEVGLISPMASLTIWVVGSPLPLNWAPWWPAGCSSTTSINRRYS